MREIRLLHGRLLRKGGGLTGMAYVLYFIRSMQFFQWETTHMRQGLVKLSPINKCQFKHKPYLLTLPLCAGVSRVRALSPAWTGSPAQETQVPVSYGLSPIEKTALNE
jgi:hypothetical protein